MDPQEQQLHTTDLDIRILQNIGLWRDTVVIIHKVIYPIMAEGISMSCRTDIWTRVLISHALIIFSICEHAYKAV